MLKNCLHAHNVLKVGKNHSTARRISSFIKSFYISASPTQIFPQGRVEDICLGPEAIGPGHICRLASAGCTPRSGYMCCACQFTIPAHCPGFLYSAQHSFPPIWQVLFSFLCPAQLLLQPAGHSDANSPGETAESWLKRQRLTIH